MLFTPPRTSSFDARSVLLFAALALGGAAALRAQITSEGDPRTGLGPGAATQTAMAQKVSLGRDAQSSAAFAKADINQDSHLSAQEAGTLPAIGNHFEQLDSNHDGFLSRDEFNQGAQR